MGKANLRNPAPLRPFGDQLEQHAGLGLVLAGVRQVIQDDQVESVELGQGRWQLQALKTRLLETGTFKER